MSLARWAWRTSAGSSIATSSRATSCSRATAGRWSPTSGSPGWRPTPRARSRARPSARSTTSARSRRRARRRPAPPTSTALAWCCTRHSPGSGRGPARRRRPWRRSGSVPTRRRRARSAPRSRPPSTRSSSGRSIRTRRAASPAGSRWHLRSSRSSRGPTRRARPSGSRVRRWPPGRCDRGGWSRGRRPIPARRSLVHYFSPEQAKGETTTGASDVYSLGLCCTRHSPGSGHGPARPRRPWRRSGSVPTRPRRAPSAPRSRPPSTRSSSGRSIPTRRAGSPAGIAMAAALEPIVSRPDPSSPTVGIPSATLAAGAAAIVAGGAGRGSVTAGAGCRRAGASGCRRAIGGRAADATAVGLEPGQAGRCDLGSASVAGHRRTAVRAGRRRGRRRRRPVRRVASRRCRFGRRRTRHDHAKTDPDAAPDRPADPGRRSSRRPPTPTPTPVPKPATKPPARGARDLCDPILGFACGLEKGTYEPSRFEPPIRFKLRDGWSTSLWEADLIALGRPEGGLTFASGLLGVYPNGDATDAPRSRRSLIETFIVTDGVAAGRPHDIRVDKRRATVVDLAPTGPDRVALFGTSTQTYLPRGRPARPASSSSTTRMARSCSPSNRSRIRPSRRSSTRPIGSSTASGSAELIARPPAPGTLRGA